MKITVKELRTMVESVLLAERGGDLRKSELFDSVQFNPDAHDMASSFLDRWDHPLPTKPESMTMAGVRNWLEANNVSSISVRGKKMSPNNFVKFIGHMGQSAGNIPVYKGVKDSEASTKTGEIPVYKGAPVKKKRRQYSDEPPNEFFSAWPM